MAFVKQKLQGNVQNKPNNYWTFFGRAGGMDASAFDWYYGKPGSNPRLRINNKDAWLKEKTFIFN